MYARLCLFIKDRKSLAEGDKLEALAEVTEDTELAQRIIDAAKTSMGALFFSALCCHMLRCF